MRIRLERLGNLPYYRYVLRNGCNASMFDGSLATLISTLLDDRERRMALDREAAKAARRLDVPSIAARHLEAWTPS